MTTHTFDERDAAIVAERETNWNKRTGPRVGDFVKMQDGTLRRFTHDWGEAIQTTLKGNVDSSFYFGDAYMDFSGSLDRAIPKASLTLTDEVMEGRCWIFHHGWVGAHRGVSTKVKCRVFQQN